MLPSSIHERFVPAQSKIEPDRFLSMIAQPVVSRANLSILIERYRLYPDELIRLPAFDVVANMRPSIGFEPDANSLRVSFSYSDPRLAQRVTSDLAAGLISEHARFRANQAAMTLQFLQESVEAAAVEMEATLAKLRSAEAARQPIDRLKLDSEIARRRYESLSANRADAEMLHSLERRQQGIALALVDPASVPSEWRPSPLLCGLLGQ